MAYLKILSVSYLDTVFLGRKYLPSKIEECFIIVEVE